MQFIVMVPVNCPKYRYAGDTTVPRRYFPQKTFPPRDFSAYISSSQYVSAGTFLCHYVTNRSEQLFLHQAQDWPLEKLKIRIEISDDIMVVLDKFHHSITVHNCLGVLYIFSTFIVFCTGFFVFKWFAYALQESKNKKIYKELQSIRGFGNMFARKCRKFDVQLVYNN